MINLRRLTSPELQCLLSTNPVKPDNLQSGFTEGYCMILVVRQTCIIPIVREYNKVKWSETKWNKRKQILETKNLVQSSIHMHQHNSSLMQANAIIMIYYDPAQWRWIKWNEI